MARVVRPWWRRRRGWFATVNGKQVPLGVTDPGAEAAAWAALNRLIEKGKVSLSVPGDPVASGITPYRPKPSGPSCTVKDAVDAWHLSTLKNPDLKPKSREVYARWHREVVNRLGSKAVATLTADDVEDSSRVPTWSKSTRHCYLDTALAALKASGWIPDRKVKKPRKTSAGTVKVITEEQHWQIVGRARGDFREFVRCLWELGCRPGELASLTAEKVNWKDRVAVLTEHKNEGTGRPRTLYFSPAAMAVLEGQLKSHRTGLLFRSKTSGKFTDILLVKRFWTIAKQLGFPVTAYSYRHTFITRALLKGISAPQVAELTGTSLQMISKNYGHLEARSGLMLDVLEKMAG